MRQIYVRSSLIIGLAVTLFATVAAVATPFAYITNQGANTVSVIDLATNQVVDTIAVSKGPAGVVVDGKGKRVYVSNVDGRSVSVISTAKRKVIDEIKFDIAPVGLALTNDGSQLYVADWYSDRIWHEVLPAKRERISLTGWFRLR